VLLLLLEFHSALVFVFRGWPWRGLDMFMFCMILSAGPGGRQAGQPPWVPKNQGPHLKYEYIYDLYNSLG
jgi:hypothetical protein